jgi:membrane protein DedA with SNARE-associated domain
LGAWINYFLSLKLGRPFLHRWGKYVFLTPEKLERAEALFREYGDVTTFVCRLIPVVRQLISIPAGISRMNLARFSLFTAAGAGLWVVILTVLGYWLGATTEGLSYGELVHEGQALVKQHLIWILLGGGALIAGYCQVHRLAAGKKSR